MKEGRFCKAFPEEKIFSENKERLIVDFLRVHITAVLQITKKIPLPWIEKGRLFAKYKPASGCLQGINQAVLSHPLLAGTELFLLKKETGVLQA